jgi:hypothetical protein
VKSKRGGGHLGAPAYAGSRNFAVPAVNLYRRLVEIKKEYILSKQPLAF